MLPDVYLITLRQARNNEHVGSVSYNLLTEVIDAVRMIRALTVALEAAL